MFPETRLDQSVENGPLFLRPQSGAKYDVKKVRNTQGHPSPPSCSQSTLQLHGHPYGSGPWTSGCLLNNSLPNYSDKVDRRGLFCSPDRYRSLVADRLDAIRAHGDPGRFGDYFPAYLLKCLQDFFDRHGDDLYCELKHIRNALECLQASLAKCQRASEQSRHIEAIASAHRILRAGTDTKPQPDPHQIALFCKRPAQLWITHISQH